MALGAVGCIGKPFDALTLGQQRRLADAEKLRLAMTKADSVEIDFALEDGRVLTAWLGLAGQEAQKSPRLLRAGRGGADSPAVLL